MEFINNNILSLIVLVFSPLIAFSVILSPLLGDNEVFIRRFSKGFASLHFLYSLLFLAVFDPTNLGYSFETELKTFDVSWLKSLGITATFGVDGLSILLVVLTSFMVLIALIVSKNIIRTRYRFYYSMMFLLQTAVLGVFCAKDMFLFFLFWELELVPMYFLISEWGSGESKKSAMKFLLYTFFGSMFMLLGMLMLYFYSFSANGVMTANIDSLNIAEPSYPLAFQILIFIFIMIGFAVKLPIIPFHTWLPDAHTDAATPVSMLLAAVLLKMGAYGIIRFNLMIFPDIFKMLAPIIMVFALINIIWAAMCAIVQKDLKRLVAYSSISHMGIVLLGLAAINQIGINGAIFQMIAHSFITAGLFLVVGIVYARCKTRDISVLSGLGEKMPILMMTGLVISLAATGLPLLAGFPGELMAFIGTFTSDVQDGFLPKIAAFIAVFAIILSAAYVLKLFHGIFYSGLPSQYNNVKDVSGHILGVLLILVAIIVVFGVSPSLLIDYFSTFTSILTDILKV